MPYQFDNGRDIPVTLGTLVLHLTGYRLSGSSILHEDGTADGTSAVTAAYPRGTRMTLRGQLSPLVDTAAAAVALDTLLRAQTASDLTVGGLCLPGARVLAYTLEADAGAPVLSVVFLTAAALTEVAP